METYSRDTIDIALRVGIPIAREIEAARRGYHMDMLMGPPIPEYEEEHTVPASTSVSTPASASASASAPVSTSTRAPVLTYSEALDYSSTKIGQMGEEAVIDVLRERFVNVERTGHIAHSGDIKLVCDHGKLIVEVKSYSNYVPRPQVQKFRRDLRDTGASAGLFISLRSSIAGFRDKFSIVHEYTDKYIPVIYISYPSADMIKTSLVILVQLLGALEYINTLKSSAMSLIQQMGHLEETADNLANVRRKTLEISGEMNNALSNLVSDVAASESRMRDVLSKVSTRDEDYSGVAIITELKSHNRFIWYEQNIQDGLLKFIFAINQKIPKPVEPQWHCVSGRYICKFSGHSVRLMAGAPEVTIPRTGIPRDRVINMLECLGGDITISTDITMKLTKKTLDHIIGCV
jgi:hypothetical protein